MMNCSTIRKYGFSLLIPLLLLIAPLFTYPLVWQKLAAANVPLWGDAIAMTFPALGFLAAAAVFCVPARLCRIWEFSRLRILLIFAAAGIVSAWLQNILYGGPAEFAYSSGFFFLVPVAGILYSQELKRIFPLFAALIFLPVLVITWRSENFSGWAGNWNWNFSLLAVCASSFFFLNPKWSIRKSALTGLAVICTGLAAVSFFHPELTPRGTFAGIIGASCCIFFFRNVKPNRRWAFAIWAAALTVVLFIGSVGTMFNRILDSRFQLWRGSFDFVIAHFPLGVGPDRFESMITPYLPEIYYFTPFAASRHPHPHNELLNAGACYGFAGIVFFVLLLLLVLRGIRKKDRLGIWLGWCVLLLAVHGQFDVLLSIPQTGFWFLLGAGVLAGNGLSAGRDACGSHMRIPGYTAAIICLLLAVSQIYFSWMGSRHLRLARLELLKKNPAGAKANLHTGLNYQLSAPALYTAGAVELFNFRDPDEAIRLLELIRSRLGLPGIYHSNALLGRAYALKQDYPRSIDSFDRELHYYPMSAVASGLKLMVLRQMKSDSKTIFDENQRFLRLMQLRELKPEEFPRLLRNQDLDDRPLKLQKEE